MSDAIERLQLGQGHTTIEDEHLARYRFASQFVQGMQVADIACGTGYGSQMLAEAGARTVHAMDLSAEAIAGCVERYDNPAVTYETANAEDLARIPDGQFELVASFETIEHLPHVEAYLDEMARVLRVGGTFLVSTPDRRLSSVLHRFTGRPANAFHVREYTERELLALLRSRFRIEAVYGQRYVRRWLVFLPVQLLLRSLSRLPGTRRLRALKDRIYSFGGTVEVTPKQGSHIATFWVVACTRL